MDRFVSNTINKVDKKGRVSIPASFRLILGAQPVLYTLLSVEHPAVEAGGPGYMDFNRQRLDQMDPFSEEYEMWSFYLEGDSSELKIDSEGRIALSDQIREHASITDQVAFVGRGHFFQIWEPEAFRAYRETARQRVREMRRQLGGQSGFRQNSPLRPVEQSFRKGAGTSHMQGGGEEQDT